MWSRYEGEGYRGECDNIMFLHNTISYWALILIVLKYRLSACLSVWLPVCLSGWLSVCLSGCLSVCLSGCLSGCLSACLSVCLSVCLAACLSEDGLLLFHSSYCRKTAPILTLATPLPCLSLSMTRCASTSASKEYKTDVVHDDWWRTNLSC